MDEFMDPKRNGSGVVQAGYKRAFAVHDTDAKAPKSADGQVGFAGEFAPKNERNFFNLLISEVEWRFEVFVERNMHWISTSEGVKGEFTSK
jgi:hypothetical protein